MQEKKFMFIDDNYAIDEDLPTYLKSLLAELQGYYDNDDWIGFDCLLEVIEADIKSYRLNGSITEQQLDTLFRRYGLR